MSYTIIKRPTYEPPHICSLPGCSSQYGAYQITEITYEGGVVLCECGQYWACYSTEVSEPRTKAVWAKIRQSDAELLVAGKHRIDSVGNVKQVVIIL